MREITLVITSIWEITVLLVMLFRYVLISKCFEITDLAEKMLMCMTDSRYCTHKRNSCRGALFTVCFRALVS